jgi:hypothetical protein
VGAKKWLSIAVFDTDRRCLYVEREVAHLEANILAEVLREPTDHPIKHITLVFGHKTFISGFGT